MSRPKGSTNKPKDMSKDVSNDCLFIENLSEVLETVKKDMEQQRQNPSFIIEENSEIAFKDGKPYRIIGNEYIEEEKAQIILQKRRVVRAYLKLQELIQNNSKK